MRPRQVVLNYLEANGTATEAEIDTELSTSSNGDGGFHDNVDTSALLARLTANNKIVKAGDDYSLPV